MTDKAPTHVAKCRCGAVEAVATAKPFAVNACYCDDCQAAGRRIEAEGGPALNPDGGTEMMMFRRDRFVCTKGEDRLQALRLSATTKTRRMIASCCQTPMYAAFDDKRPWVSAYRAPFGEAAPPVEMRICTRFRPGDAAEGDPVPSHPSYPPVMVFRLLGAGLGMMFAKPPAPLP